VTIRKALFIFIPLVFILSGAAYWWLMIRPLSIAERARPEAAIPLGASVVAYFPDMGATLGRYGGMPYYPLLEGITAINGMSAVARGLDSLARADSEFWEMLDHRSVWMASVPRPGNLAANFVAMPIDRLTQDEMANMLRKLVGEKAGISTQITESNTVFKVVGERPYKSAFFALADGLVLASNDEAVLLGSLQQLTSGTSLLTDPDFAKCVAAAGQRVDAVVILNHDRMDEHMGVHLKRSVLTLPPFSEELATWSVLDVTMHTDGLGVNGFTYTGDSLNRYTAIFSKQPPQPVTFPAAMPASTAGFVMFGVNSMSRFYTDYRTHLQLTEGVARHDSAIARINRQYEVDIEIELFSWVEGEFGVCITTSAGGDTVPDSYAVFKTRSTTQADEALSGLVLKLEQQRIRQVVDSVSDVTIHRIGIDNILPELLGEMFDQFNETYYMILGDHVVMGTSMESMKRYARQVLAHRTLGNDPSFTGLISKLSSNFNIFLYAKPDASRPVWESYLNHSALTSLGEQNALVNGFSAVAMQLSSSASGLYTSGHALFGGAAGGSDNVWEGATEKEAIAGPWPATNEMTGEPELLVQDASNALYLLDRFGQPVWSREVDAPVLGEVLWFKAKDGHMRAAFCTEAALYLVDRSGKDMPGFPVRFGARASVPLTVVAYDGGKEHRLLVGCADGKVLNFDLAGKPVQGWSFAGSRSAIDRSVLHIVSGNNDHLITHSADGVLHILDRKGKSRLKSDIRMPLAAGSELNVLKTKGGVKVLGTDSIGQLVAVSLDGKMTVSKAERLSDSHRSFTIERDGAQQWVMTDLNTVKVLSEGGKPLWEMRLAPDAHSALVTSGNGPMYICTHDPENRKVKLHDAVGKAAHESGYSRGVVVTFKDPDGGIGVAAIDADGRLRIRNGLKL
jgi:hypothetical protein